VRVDNGTMLPSVSPLCAETSATYDNVFTSGVADLTTLPPIASLPRLMNHIDVRLSPRAVAGHYDRNGQDLNGRLRMARIPDSATLIDNPVSIACRSLACKTCMYGRRSVVFKPWSPAFCRP
jgi:molybdopterin-biosynthesis enzyme MoeA-like protein